MDNTTKDRQIFKLFKDSFDALIKALSNQKVEIKGAEIITIKGPKGDKPSPEELVELIKPLIPEPIQGRPGKNGENYILKEEDKDEIASKIKPIIVDKVIEKTESVVVEKPVVKKEIIEVARKLNAEEVVELLRSYKNPWLDVDSLVGDLRAKFPPSPSHGGANNALVDIYNSSGTLLGGVREVQFEGSGISTELINQGTRLLVTVAGGLGNIADDEIPGGAQDGSNKTFTLAHTPNPISSVKLYKNGQKLSVGKDYDITDTSLVYTTDTPAPEPDDIITVDYRY